ncbi:MAG: hypothetical protein A2Y33_07805 [Spirochaetes bacterium GWF1_51_8]|nr:MAG: hypothetical protein A2Y33_07805 [Spirochaetes bacterium GWF1_51_8]
MKIFRILPFMLLLAGTVFSQTEKSGYDLAAEWYEKKHYVRAVEILKEYMEEYPLDTRANELLEKMYDKYTEFLKVYLEGKDYYNKKLYLKTIQTFSNALEVGFSDKLQFYLTECIRTVFDIENTFLPGGIADNGETVSITWESPLLTNATVTFIKSDNLPLLNMIYYLNKNKIPVPHLEKYFTQGNVFKSLAVQGNSYSFAKDQPVDSYLVMIYPRTSEDVRSQPIIHMVITKPPVLENEYMMIVPADDVPVLPVYTNYSGVPQTTNTNKQVALTSLSNILSNFILTNPPGTNIALPQNDPDSGIFPWWWLLILLALIALWLYRHERKRKRREELIRKWKLEILETLIPVEVPRKPPSSKKKTFKKALKGKKLPLIVLLLSCSLMALFAQDAAETPEWKKYAQGSLTPETWNYYIGYYNLTDLPPSPYEDIVKFYSFEKSEGLPGEYSRAIEFLRDTSAYLRRICETYFRNFDFENYALTSFMVYYIDKDYSFFSQSISELKKGKTGAIAAKILQKSLEFEQQGLYLAALLRITGFMSLSPDITPDLFERISSLNKLHNQDISRFEYISALKRMAAIVADKELSVPLKNFLCLREIFEYKARFAPYAPFDEMKKKIIKLLIVNYRVMVFNGLLTEGEKAYMGGQMSISKQCFELAWHIAPNKELRPALDLCIAKASDALAGKGVVYLYLTNMIVP